MKGTNKITFNQETMCAAVQEYLAARMPTTPIKVDRVEQEKDGSQGFSSGPTDFRVTVTTTPDPVPA